MKYIPLGNTGLQISEVCLGTAALSREADEAAAVAIMNHALNAGINFFDTADEANQERVGRRIGPHRDGIILAASVQATSDPKRLIASVEQSLEKLQTDWIDILYLRYDDAGSKLEESLYAVTSLIHQGKVMYFGLANFPAWQTMKAMTAAPVVCIQPIYNLIQRQAEVEILPHAHSENLAVFPGSPRIQNNKSAPSAGQFYKYAKKKELSPAALAVAWVAAHPDVTAPIIDPANLEQLNELLQSLDIDLSEEQRAEITALSIAPPLATDR